MTSGVASVDMEDRTRGVEVMKLEAPGMSEEAPAMGVFVPPFSSSPGGCGGITKMYMYGIFFRLSRFLMNCYNEVSINITLRGVCNIIL